ncbi:hypothetical protein H257_03979 [Aphanomyces astaci]|uniref:FAD/NAD(P)-binding domain-containing protein n=1 Tax=Aphanomyces astaci TaxID=112090 RepID=W4GTY9_APHAT|nr:hypothetical protein H257_03979 [Aphanomyces astaci]ETV83190.1 hypothetical protein H257_03979 [Aphanomyces astaci]RQM23002.1 hypothetical protein B5M09_003536 [Aphanomyces astaci]|eukprot:XP_009826620.1 hypothetical protein H257_03979 [Aphanomyces astaci]
MMMPPPSNIVVVGGGYIGVQFAQELAKHLTPSQASITLIEKNDFTFHCVGVPRALVDPTFVKKLFIPLDHALPSTATILRGIVDKIDGKVVVVRPIVDDKAQSTPTRVPFDYLVLATGSSYVSPIKVPLQEYTRASVEAAITATAEHIKAASSVLVVGGGPVGVEIAAEVAAAYPSKHVTILERHNRLMHNAGVKDAFREQLTAKLAKLNVHVVLGERLIHDSEPPASAVVTTDRGTSIDADMQLLCAGMLPNVDLIRRLDPTLLSIRSRGIRVNGACQIDDRRYSHVFVVGDASDHPTPKLAYVGAFQAKHVAAQLAKVVVSSTTSSSSSRKEVVLEPYVPPTSEGLLVPLGPTLGVGQVPVLGGIVVGDVVVRFIKGNDYFASTFLDQWHTTEDGAAIPPKKRSGGWAVLVVAVAVAAWYFSKS